MWAADEIEATVSGLFTTRHRLRAATGSLGEFTLPALRSDGIFRTREGRELEVRRTSWWRGEYELREGEAVLGTARARGAFRREIVVEFDGREYTLRAAGFWARRWQLLDEGGTCVLEIEPQGVFRRGAYLTIHGPVNADLLVFAYYLVHMRWQEQSAAAGAAAAAS
jgi:hypothetical protein